MSSADATPVPPPAGGSLLFYRNPEALSPSRHGALRLKKAGDYAFARDSNSVSITSTEFAQVMRFYPIVFAGEAPYPVAVLGLERANQFVKADGQWLSGHYVPAYMRRYPFVFIAQPDGKQFILGIDRACTRLTQDEQSNDVLPLFENEKPAQVTQDALRFCGAFQMDHGFTLAFSKALDEQKLLVENQAQAQLPGGRQLKLAGFRIIDKARFAELPDAIIVDWHKKGWLALANLHLTSLERWSALLEREAVPI